MLFFFGLIQSGSSLDSGDGDAESADIHMPSVASEIFLPQLDTGSSDAFSEGSAESTGSYMSQSNVLPRFTISCGGDSADQVSKSLRVFSSSVGGRFSLVILFVLETCVKPCQFDKTNIAQAAVGAVCNNFFIVEFSQAEEGFIFLLVPFLDKCSLFCLRQLQEFHVCCLYALGWERFVVSEITFG